MRPASARPFARLVRRATPLIAALGVALVAPVAGAADAGAADDGGPRRLVVATQDAELLSALSVAFVPRGVEVTAAPQPLRTPSDRVAAVVGPRAGDDAVWLCEPAEGGTALCVRPHHGQVIVRRIAMATPLSAEDAAALALSVEATLLPAKEAPAAAVAPPPAVLVAPAPAPALARAPLHRLSLELLGGAHVSGAGARARAGAAVAFTPGTGRFRLGVGAGVETGPAGAVAPNTSGPGPSMPGGSDSDLTLRAFVRGALRLGPVWLHADAGPAAHVLTRQLDDHQSGSPGDDLRAGWSADSALGVIVPVGHFFAGARAGASYRLDARARDPIADRGRWAAEASLAVGVAFF